MVLRCRRYLPAYRFLTLQQNVDVDIFSGCISSTCCYGSDTLGIYVVDEQIVTLQFGYVRMAYEEGHVT